MFLSLMLLLQAGLPSQSLPKPLTAEHMRDIGCVATLGLFADEQRRAVPASRRFPNVTEKGKVYAGIIGDRVVFESGQSKEAVALAIRLSAKDQHQQAIAAQAAAPATGLGADTFVDGLMAKCLPLLEAELDVIEAPLPSASAQKGEGG